MNRGLVLGAATVAVTLVLTLMCAEAAARWLGGFPILALRLPTVGLAPQLPSSRETADARYLPQISLAKGVDQAYAQVQRLSDFQQRVFRAYAARYDLLYLDSAAMYPLDPQLFADAVHMTPAGLRLKAWIDLQLLIPWLEREIDSGHLPRPMQHPQAVHPAFASTSYPLVSKAEILASCH